MKLEAFYFYFLTVLSNLSFVLAEFRSDGTADCMSLNMKLEAINFVDLVKYSDQYLVGQIVG